MKKVLVFGTFDGLHPGHINFFQQAKKLGDELIVVVARDATVEKVKGRRPRKNENARLSDARNAGIAGEVLLGNLGDTYAIIKQIKPDIIA
ncbi:MAG: adenylyltransferase/cytidyltransferase family protein, partial [Minisyncoccales bacterium]